MRWACCAMLAATACYSPNFAGGAPCDPGNANCPNGQTCVASAGASMGTCTISGGAGADGGNGGGGDGGSGSCLGAHLLGSVCLTTPPTEALVLTGTINTGMAGAGGCTELHPQTGGPMLCIVSGTTIAIGVGTTLRAIGLDPVGSNTTTTNPLVLVATQSITIDGVLDASSRFMETVAGGVPDVGAGARTSAGCLVTGVDGTVGSGNAGGGGGAGGSFGAAGGAGGSGGNNGATAHGNPAAAAAPTVLVGGCPGGHGGDGAGGGGFTSGGAGGNAGGAVYLLAGTSISITGNINVSGSGGDGGGPGSNSSGGGGGGGAGGMIGLEAGSITMSGTLFANGGGGGGGGGNQGMNDSGNKGADPSVASAAATGGTATNNGGAGGAGSVGTTVPVNGKNGGGNQPQCAGGGGGGGAGVIRVYGAPASSLGGTISPPAS